MIDNYVKDKYIKDKTKDISDTHKMIENFVRLYPKLRPKGYSKYVNRYNITLSQIKDYRQDLNIKNLHKLVAEMKTIIRTIRRKKDKMEKVYRYNEEISPVIPSHFVALHVHATKTEILFLSRLEQIVFDVYDKSVSIDVTRINDNMVITVKTVGNISITLFSFTLCIIPHDSYTATTNGGLNIEVRAYKPVYRYHSDFNNNITSLNRIKKMMKDEKSVRDMTEGTLRFANSCWEFASYILWIVLVIFFINIMYNCFFGINIIATVLSW